MKKLGCILLCLVFLSCSKNNEGETDLQLIGQWENSFEIKLGDFPSVQELGYEHVAQYSFQLDRSFEYNSFIRHMETGNILAYAKRFVGTYTLEGNRMNLAYTHWGAEPLSDPFEELKGINDLVVINEVETWGFAYAISDNQKLVFNFDPCGPAENCLGSMTLFRVQ